MEAKNFNFVGPSCGHHASYTFYKAVKFNCKKTNRDRILSLGEFFFVKIWEDSDLVSVGELQLLWEDRNTGQTLSSLRLYFLPEYTPEGRMQWHGEDELVAVSEKAVLKISDLLDWVANPREVRWDRGLLGVYDEDCEEVNKSSAAGESANNNEAGSENSNNSLSSSSSFSAQFHPGGSGLSDFLADVRAEKKAIGDMPHPDDSGVVILSLPQYSRYRGLTKRLAGKETSFMRNSMVVSLGGFTVATKKTYVLFCRENFDYAELEEHPFLCNHLAPKLKGRPRKKKKIKRPGSPESESASSESSVSTSVSLHSKNGKNGVKKDLISLLSQKNTKEELDFLKKLTNFMESRNTPIERPPMLGFKQIDLHLFYQKVSKYGGYEGCVAKKSWKAIYDELGGNPQNTSAATCTRRHYEKFLLPFERYMKGQDSKMSRKFGASESVDESSEKSPEKEEDDSRLSEEKAEETPKKGEEDVDKAKALLAQGLQSLMDGKTEAQMKIDPEGKKLQIDDLIIIPNQLAGLPEGGSALQNLAKIASRYQNTGAKAKGQGTPTPDETKISQPLPSSSSPATSAQGKKASNPAGAAAAAAAASAANIFNLLPPGMMPGWPSMSGGKPGSSGSSGKGSPQQQAAAMAAAIQQQMTALASAGFADPALLQYYEKQLKALATGAAAAAATTSQSPVSANPGGPQQQPSPVSQSPSPFKNGRESVNSQTSVASSSKSKAVGGGSADNKESSGNNTPSSSSTAGRDRSKVCKPPPENKRPPSLMQTPCAFVQTNHFYTNPLAEVQKLREKQQQSSTTPASAAPHMHQQPHAQSDILDLSGGATAAKRAKLDPDPSMIHHGFPPGFKKESLDLSLKKESALLSQTLQQQQQHHAAHFGFPSSTSGPPKHELKASPFSAESLLSKSSATPAAKPSASSSSSSSHHDLVKIAPTLHQQPQTASGHPKQQHRSSPIINPANLPRASPTVYGSSSSGHSSSSSAAPRASPWHTPVVSSAPASIPYPAVKESKQTIPVSPVVREKEAAAASLASLAGLLPPSSTVSSMAGLPPASYAASLASSSLSPAQQQALLANPYLALMSQGQPKPGGAGSASSAAAAAAAAAAASYPGAHLMDPATSAYYAALYSQQMYGAAGLANYGLGAAAAGLRPGLPPSAAAAAASGLDPMQAQAMQALLAASSGRPPTSTGAPTGSLPPGLGGASTAGAAPYGSAAAAAAAAAGFPAGFPGLSGYPGFPPPGRKDP